MAGERLRRSDYGRKIADAELRARPRSIEMKGEKDLETRRIGEQAQELGGQSDFSIARYRRNRGPNGSQVHHIDLAPIGFELLVGKSDPVLALDLSTPGRLGPRRSEPPATNS